jgi:hypothetical protein
LGDPEIPVNQNCQADTCLAPENFMIESSLEQSIEQLKERFPDYDALAINEEYYNALKKCRDLTVSIGGHLGDACMIDLTAGQPVDSYADIRDCAIPEKEPTKAQKITYGNYEYATLPYNSYNSANGPGCMSDSSRPPSG